MKKSTSMGLICCLAFGLGCTEDNKKKDSNNPQGQQPLPQQSTVTQPPSEQTATAGDETTPVAPDGSYDLALVSEDVSSQVEDAIDAINTEDGSFQILGGLGLTDPSTTPSAVPKDVHNQERTCTIETNSAGVKETKIAISSNFSFSRSFENTRISRSSSVVNSSLMTRIWSKPGTEIPCDKNKTHIVLALADRKGITMNGSFEEEASVKSQVKRGESVTKFEHTKKAKGDRKVEFTDVVVADNTLTVKKSISYALEKSFTRLNKNGETKTSNMSIATAEGSPIVIEAIHDKKTQKWNEQKIVSGTSVATYKTGDRLELTYQNVVYNTANRCQGVSGTITGSYFKAGALDKPAHTFTINMADEVKEISFGDGQKQLFEISGCSFNNVAQPMIKWTRDLNAPLLHKFLENINFPGRKSR
jgi:hypothetical protein